MIFGEEHYNPLYHSFVCYASPVYEPSGDLLGSVNITGPLDQWNPMILSVLQMAVNGMERQFELTRENDLLSALVASIPQGVILMDRKERVLFFNERAQKLLHLDDTELTGTSVFSLVQRESLPEILRDFGSPVRDEDCTVVNRNGEALDLSLSFSPSEKNTNGLDFAILFLQSQTYIHNLTSRMAGFSANCDFDSLIGASPAWRQIVSMGKIAAERSVPVLLSGEKGTGKRMLAQAIHNAGADPNAAFVEVNCSSIPSGMLENELFGQTDPETGTRLPGKIELAYGGTLYLDEITALSCDVQKKLADILREMSAGEVDAREASPAADGNISGGRFRLIASTSGSLLSYMEKGAFREDLYYLLNGISIIIPPLRERPEDIAVLAGHFAEDSAGGPVVFSADCMEALTAYPWKENIRELEDSVRQSLLNSGKKYLDVRDLPDKISGFFYARIRSDDKNDQAEYIPHVPETDPVQTDPGRSADAREYYLLTKALKESGGNAAKAANSLNIPLSTFYRKLSRQNIHAKDYRSM